MRMSPEEIEREHAYRYAERIAILCELSEPTAAQREIARTEADKAMLSLREQPDLI